MTFQQMHDLLKTFLDKYDTPYFSSQQLDLILTRAMYELIENRFRNFEGDERITQDLRPLVREYIVPVSQFNATTDALVLPNTHAVLTNMLYIVSIRCEYKCGDSYKITYVKPVKHDELMAMMKDPFRKPTCDYPVYVLRSGGIYIYPQCSYNNFEITIIQKPTPINATGAPTGVPILPEQTHDEIVQIAARMLLNTIHDFNKYSNFVNVEIPRRE